MQLCMLLILIIKMNPYKILALSLLSTLLGVLISPALHATAASSISVTYAGTYTPSLSYAQGNVVKYGNCTYIALGAIAANASPSARPSAWTVFGVLPENNLFGSGSNTFSLDFVTIGNPGNRNDTTGYGGVPYNYQIGTYTISQNQVILAISNGATGLQGSAGQTWSGDQPATGLTWYQCAAFVNWLNANQGYTPAYNLTYSNGAYSVAVWPTNQAWTNGGTNLYRNANCVYFLPSENEWYKAAYYDPNKNNGAGGYWPYPTGSSNTPTAVASGTTAFTAVFVGNGVSPSGPASVYQAGGLSRYGTMAQGGNVTQVTDTLWRGAGRDPSRSFDFVNRGADFGKTASYFSSTNNQGSLYPSHHGNFIGFRVGRILP